MLPKLGGRSGRQDDVCAADQVVVRHDPDLELGQQLEGLVDGLPLYGLAPAPFGADPRGEAGGARLLERDGDVPAAEGDGFLESSRARVPRAWLGRQVHHDRLSMARPPVGRVARSRGS
jgi:hypothetical protein